MHNTFFRFKQFTIHQDRCAMKVGTDGVLLGAWVRTEGVKKVLDIGSGTGLISIMFAQRSSAIITGIDLDEEAIIQARENAAETSWKNRTQFLHISYQEFLQSRLHNSSPEKFDLIISNPPFHPEHIKPESDRRRLARHSDELSPEEILSTAKNILNSEGRIAMIVPEKILDSVFRTADENQLYLIRHCQVRPTPQKNIHRNLLEFCVVAKDFQEEALVIELNERHDYSEEYKSLTRDFYLKF